MTEKSPKPEQIAQANREAEAPVAAKTGTGLAAELRIDAAIESVSETQPAVTRGAVAGHREAEGETPTPVETPVQTPIMAEQAGKGSYPVGVLTDREPEPETVLATACAKEAVDEATLLPEAASRGASAPELPEPHMDSNHSIREQRAEHEQPQSTLAHQTREESATSKPDREQSASSPETEGSEQVASTAQPGAAQGEAASADREQSVAQSGATPDRRGGEGEETPATEPVPDGAQKPPSEVTAEQTASPGRDSAAAAQPPAKHFIKLEARENETDTSPFSVIVSQVYDGPLDLLLDLIRKQDIDIYDIPIARITAQFLAYVNQLKASDVDVAGEFIYTASLLIHIKSKMLLPRAPAGPDDQAEDPRRELVERLLEHERFKNAAQMLQQKQMLEAATWTNPGIREFRDDVEAEPEIAADTVDLVRVFREILERARNRPVLNVEEDSVTVGQMIQFLARRLNMEDKPVALRRLLSHTRSERALIAMFLALLELVRLQAILLRQDRAFSEIFIKKNSEFDAVMNEGLANARDDWR